MSFGEADSVVPDTSAVRAINDGAPGAANDVAPEAGEGDPPEAAGDGAANDAAFVRDIVGTKSERSGEVAPSARKAIGSGEGSLPGSDADISETGEGEDSNDLPTTEFTDGVGRSVGVGCASFEGSSTAALLRRRTRSGPAMWVAGSRTSADADNVRIIDATVPTGPSERRSWPRGRAVAASCGTGICAASERCTAMFAVTGIACWESNSGGGSSRQPCGSRGWPTSAGDSVSGTRWISGEGLPW